MPDIIQRLRDTYQQNPAAALNMLPELFQAEEDGLIIELPCKVGDTVYITIYSKFDIPEHRINEFIISRFYISGSNDLFALDVWGHTLDMLLIGKTVFLTRAEAEKALESEE